MTISLAVVKNTFLALVLGFILQLVAFGMDIWRWLAFGRKVSDVTRRHVVITGCDSGFGHLLALRLLRKGMTVHAGCLTKSGLDNLEREASLTVSSSQNLHAFSLDVTQDASVAAARDAVATKLPSDGLWGLVCNAGMKGPWTPDDWNNIQDYCTVMDVNFMGHVRMTHAFRSLMSRNAAEGGRLVYMCSMLGHMIRANIIPYKVSKTAVVAYAESLRTELTTTNLKVITICPGFFKTDLNRTDKIGEEYLGRWRTLDIDVRARYGSEDVEKLPPKVEQHLVAVKHMTDCLDKDNAVVQVVDAYEDALLCLRPKLTYWIGSEVIFARVFEHLGENAQILFSEISRKLRGDV